MQPDRRKHARVSLGVEVDLHSGSNFFVGRTRDLSMGGLFIETPIPLPIGTVVSLELFLTGTKHPIRGEVMWALDAADGETVGVGLRFLELSSRARAAIQSFMRRRVPVAFEEGEPDFDLSSDEATPVIDASAERDAAAEQRRSPPRQSPPPFPGTPVAQGPRATLPAKAGGAVAPATADRRH